MEIVGFGKLENGEVVHVVTGDGQMLCREKDIAFDQSLNVMAVTCKKCMRLRAFKDFIEESLKKDHRELRKEDIPEEKPVADTGSILGQTTGSEQIDPVVKSDEEKDIPAVDLGSEQIDPVVKTISDQSEEKIKPDNLIKITINIPEDNSFPKIENLSEDISVEIERIIQAGSGTSQDLEFAKVVSSITGEFKAVLNANLKYNICHVSGNLDFFKDVPKHQIASCLLMLNSIQTKWIGCGQADAVWLSNVKKAMATGYFASMQSVPKTIKIFSEKPKDVPSKADNYSDSDVSEKIKIPKGFRKAQNRPKFRLPNKESMERLRRRKK